MLLVSSLDVYNFFSIMNIIRAPYYTTSKTKEIYFRCTFELSEAEVKVGVLDRAASDRLS